MVVDIKGDTWTYGAEHELSDWDTSLSLPIGFGRSDDYTIVNSNGVAAQPDPKVYRWGGEINTPPTADVSKQADLLNTLLNRYPNATVNHRSNLHVHVRVPGLKNCLVLLKKVQMYIHRELPKILDELEPIPPGTTPAERKRARRRRVSHHTLLTPKRLDNQLSAASVAEFFSREVPVSKSGRVMWHAQPRVCVNLRQLMQTDTVEFRHFPGTLDCGKLLTCIEWCRDFLLASLSQRPIEQLWSAYQDRHFPQFPPFDEDREVGYQATAAHNGLGAAEIRHNIQLILKGQFNGSEAQRKARQRTCGLSR